MANVLICDVPDEVVKELKQRAKSHNRPLQQELRVVEDSLKSHSSFGGFAIHHLDTYRKLPAHR